MLIPHYYEDPSTLHVNTMPNRAYYVPASSAIDTTGEKRTASDRFILLNGTWKFRYYPSVYDLKEEFYRQDADVSAFDELPVPSVWQNHGYDRHQYTNVRYPFPLDPPYVPQDNPCGAYVHTFCYHKDPAAPCAYLNFEGVDSCFYLWLNGAFVGYSQVSHSTSEFNVTDLLQEGENRLAVLVLKWCDGSYMEDQDKFRMSGIFRDVYLLRRPKQGIFDYFVKAIPTPDYQGGDIQVDFTFFDKTIPVTCRLTDADGGLVAEHTTEDGHVTFHLAKATLWNTEQPYLYHITYTTEHEVISDTIGIREIHKEGNVVFLNGQKIKFHGVNRHDSDPVTGFVISEAQIRRDLKLMKTHNVNAIRTSHYPNAPHFYALYDAMGFYIIDEADNESHGAMLRYTQHPDWAAMCRTWNELIADNPVYTPATVDRVRRCVERDKNRPCVVIWSMGNECAYGCTFEAALAWTKSYDTSRLTHFESALHVPENKKYNFDDLDLYSRMYPSIEEIEQYLKEDGRKPYILCEYCHAMGNGPGDLEEYFQTFQAHDGICGGFVWEWCDHAIDMGRTKEGKVRYAYGGDHDEYPHDGNFCMDGLVYPDRRVHTGLREFKNVFRPARATAFDQNAGTVTLHNYMDFRNLTDFVTLSYQVTCDGKTVASGTIETLPSIPPHQEGFISLPLPSLECGKAYLKLEYRQKEDAGCLPKNFLLGFDELPVATTVAENQTVKELLTVEDGPEIQIFEDDSEVVLQNGLWRYVYDKRCGLFARMSYNNQEILNQPLEYNIWRAPTDNDRNIKNLWMRAGYDRTVARAYSTTVKQNGADVVLESQVSLSSVAIQRILNIVASWTVHPDGSVDVHLQVNRAPEFPFLPRFGLRLFLPKEMEQVTYCGIGPDESYLDKRRAGYHGVFSTDLDGLWEDYIRPQENGAHHDCDYLFVQSSHLLLSAASKNVFAFQAARYTQEEMTRKAHNYELVPCPDTVLCLDYCQSGVGSNSCGPELQKKYRLDQEQFTFSIHLKPSVR